MSQHIREVSGGVKSVVHAVHNIHTKLPRHGGPIDLEEHGSKS